MEYAYSCYSLKIISELELPELGTNPSLGGVSDVTIRFSDLPASGLPEGTQIAPFIWLKTDTFMFEVPQVARFLISGGSDIAIDPAPGIDEASLRVFLLGSAFGALLLQRGLFVLHGNAIEIDGQCLICVGPSGIGKSTLTAAFMKRGYRVLADDVVPIDDNGFAIPGFPRIKLWQDVADKMAIDTVNLSRIRPNLEKFNLPLGDNFCAIPRPVSHICVLSEHHGETVNTTPITGLEKFPLLKVNTYRPRFMAGMNLQREHLRQCSSLAGKVRMAKVQRPKVGFKIEKLVDALLANMLEEA
jgi:hypothetical protein